MEYQTVKIEYPQMRIVLEFPSKTKDDTVTKDTIDLILQSQLKEQIAFLS